MSGNWEVNKTSNGDFNIIYMSEIKAGNRYKCIEWDGPSFTVGIVYDSPEDNRLIDNHGHPFSTSWVQNHFQKIEETSNPEHITLVDLIHIPEGMTLEDIGPTGARIINECEDIKRTLLEKNKRYGDSATREGMVFGLDPVTAIKARIEDKLMRLKNDSQDEDEDITKDLLGYFILLRIALKNRK